MGSLHFTIILRLNRIDINKINISAENKINFTSMEHGYNKWFSIKWWYFFCCCANPFSTSHIDVLHCQFILRQFYCCCFFIETLIKSFWTLGKLLFESGCFVGRWKLLLWRVDVVICIQIRLMLAFVMPLKGSWVWSGKWRLLSSFNGFITE